MTAVRTALASIVLWAVPACSCSHEPACVREEPGIDPGDSGLDAGSGSGSDSAAGDPDTGPPGESGCSPDAGLFSSSPTPGGCCYVEGEERCLRPLSGRGVYCLRGRWEMFWDGPCVPPRPPRCE